MSLVRRRTHLRLVTFAATLLTLLFIAAPALAEGSDELTNNPGYRPFLLYQTNATTGNVRNFEIFKVFAQTGERINMGSSANGRGGSTIAYRAPNAAAFTACPAPAGGLGVIENRAEEQNGPFPGAGGYDPCFVDVGAAETGVWEVRITSPNQNSGANPPPTLLGADNWALGPLPDPIQPDNVRWIRAWDITVTDPPHGVGNAELGRVFADFLPLNLGANVVGQDVMQSEMFVYSEDGYVYRVDGNGLDAFGFHFYGNNVGFMANGQPIYRSVQFEGPNPGILPSFFDQLDPTAPDNVAANLFTHKIFYNLPDIAIFTTLPAGARPGEYVAPSPSGAISFVSPPIEPPQATNFTFTGEEGTPDAAGTNPLSGEFSFTLASPAPYQIKLDTNRNGQYDDDGTDRILFGQAVAGVNIVIWDGLTDNGSYVPANPIAIQVELVTFGGEVHFPLLDPENNPSGIEIERLIDPDTAVPEPSPFQVFYNDTYNYTGTNTYDYSLCAQGEGPVPPPANVPGCYGTPLSARSALLGINSAGGTHAWETDFGNRRGMDTWAFYPSPPVLGSGIVIREADLVMEKTVEPTTVVLGGNITYTLRVRNDGPSDAPGARVIDNIPPEVLNPRWRCQTVSGGAACSQNGPINGNIDTLVDLPVGGVLEFTITGTVDPNITAPFTNTATVLRPNDITDPNDPDRLGAGNNSDSATVNFASVTATPTFDLTTTGTVTVTLGTGTPGTPSRFDPFIRKSVEPPFANPGDTVVYKIVVTNPGPNIATGIRVIDTMPAELEIIRAQTTIGTVSFGGQTVTLLVADLDPGETVTVTVTARIRSSTTGAACNIRNVASLTNNENPTPRTASALVLCVGTLPSTGETPRWITDLLLIAVALSVTVIVGIATSSRKATRAG